MHDYNKIAAIVGADKIDALRDAGVNIADKPTKPTTNLMGRWAKHPDFGDVVIVNNVTINSYVMVVCRDILNAAGTSRKHIKLSDLMFPEETTRPEDVPVGEAWLVNADDGYESAEGVTAFKINDTSWVTGDSNGIMETVWENDEVELIAPLIPARPLDTDRGESPETVTTEDEYTMLPEGSIVAFTGGNPWLKDSDGKWEDGPSSVAGIAYVPRQVLRRGWGE